MHNCPIEVLLWSPAFDQACARALQKNFLDILQALVMPFDSWGYLLVDWGFHSSTYIRSQLERSLTSASNFALISLSSRWARTFFIFSATSWLISIWPTLNTPVSDRRTGMPSELADKLKCSISDWGNDGPTLGGGGGASPDARRWGMGQECWGSTRVVFWGKKVCISPGSVSTVPCLHSSLTTNDSINYATTCNILVTRDKCSSILCSSWCSSTMMKTRKLNSLWQ